MKQNSYLYFLQCNRKAIFLIIEKALYKYEGKRGKMKELIKFKNVKKTYNIGEKSFNALDGVNFEINKGEFVVILRTIRSRKINTFKLTWRNGQSNIRRYYCRR